MLGFIVLITISQQSINICLLDHQYNYHLINTIFKSTDGVLNYFVNIDQKQLNHYVSKLRTLYIYGNQNHKFTSTSIHSYDEK